jgi:hypothetical protein
MGKLRLAVMLAALALAAIGLTSYLRQEPAAPATASGQLDEEISIARDAMVQSGKMTAEEFDARIKSMKGTRVPDQQSAAGAEK